MACVSPEGSWLIYELPKADSAGEYRLMRVSMAGGPPQVIFERTMLRNFDCPHRSGFPCVISESSSNGSEDVFSSFDPVSGTRRELFRIGRNLINWTVSPDGSRIAMTGDDPEGRIEIRSLTGKSRPESK
jgi:hypothetical protein